MSEIELEAGPPADRSARLIVADRQDDVAQHLDLRRDPVGAAGLHVAALEQDGIVLDVPCGTGRYFELVVAHGRRVVGADQSAGMVEQARTRALAEAVELVGLQELAYRDAFDGVMCIDAMEHVPPDDWPRVVDNLGRALRRAGFLYLSLEVLADQEAHLDRALANALARGYPAVRGEDVGEDTGGYHFYPSSEDVTSWLATAGLAITEDVTDLSYDDWGYRHLLVRHAG